MMKGKNSTVAIHIESGVPIPPRPGYPFKQLKVGDSFLLPEDANERILRIRAASVGTRLGRKFSVRKVEGGFRVWRVQ